MKQRTSISFILGFFLLPLLVFCKGKEVESPMIRNEREAKKILEKADLLWVTEEEIEALRLYDSIAKKYPFTTVRKKAGKKLDKKGYSIGESLSSWTVKRLIEQENNIIDSIVEKGQYPLSDEVETATDAWGRKIYFKVFLYKKKAYDFIVFSDGPDQKRDTEDDLALVHFLEDYSLFKKNGIRSPGSDDGAERSLIQGGGSLSLDEIEKMEQVSGDAESSGEQVLSLDQVRENSQKGLKNDDSGDLKLTLDELRGWGK